MSRSPRAGDGVAEGADAVGAGPGVVVAGPRGGRARRPGEGGDAGSSRPARSRCADAGLGCGSCAAQRRRREPGYAAGRSGRRRRWIVAGSWIVPRNALACSVRASDPTIHRPSCPARAAGRPGRPGRQPALVLAPRDPGRLRGDRRRRLWADVNHDPVTPARRRGPRAARRAGRRRAASSPGSARPTPTSSDYLTGDRWYAPQGRRRRAPRAIAYFSPEFGITAVLPQYSGGLGILAGDHLKAARDLGVPLVGVGLFYRHGYFRQALDRDGWQQESYPVLDPDELPLTLLREADGTPRDVSIDLPGGPDLVARVWRRPRRPRAAAAARHRRRGEQRPLPRRDRPALRRRHRAPAAPGDPPRHRRRPRPAGVSRITGAPAPEVFHTNEGHAGFLGLERIRELTVGEAGRTSTSTPRSRSSRAGTVFTTHTPVPAGIDRFPRELDRAVLRRQLGRRAGVPVERILALGAEDYDGGDADGLQHGGDGLPPRPARQRRLRAARRRVSREMFNGLWPAFDEAEVPITSITNGVHAPTWVAREVIELAAEPRRRRRRRRHRRPVDARRPGPRPRDLGRQARRCASGSSTTPAAGCASRPAKRGIAAAELGWIDDGARPRRADHRLRAPRADVQAAHADAARPRAAQAAAARPRAPDAAGHRRQGPPGRRRPARS